MRRIFANLLGEWTDITDAGTVEDNQDPLTYFEENLRYEDPSTIAGCFKYDYINVQYNKANYRIHHVFKLLKVKIPFESLVLIPRRLPV